MHTVTSRRRSHGLLGALNADFTRHQGPLPWAGPALAFSSAGELLQALRVASPAEADRILHALLRQDHQGDELARRLVLQAMLGVVARHTRTARTRGLDDPEASAVTAMLEAIAGHPLRLRSRVAANLTMRALSRLPAGADTTEFPTQYAAEIADCYDRSRRQPHRPADLEATNLIAWGRTHGVLSEADADLLRRAHLRDTTASSDRLAAEAGLSCAAWRQRHHRIINRLALAVRRSLTDPRSADVG